MFAGDYTEETLCRLEAELSRLQEVYRENKDVFEKISKREGMWQQFLQLEVS